MAYAIKEKSADETRVLRRSKTQWTYNKNTDLRTLENMACEKLCELS